WALVLISFVLDSSNPKHLARVNHCSRVRELKFWISRWTWQSRQSVVSVTSDAPLINSKRAVDSQNKKWRFYWSFSVVCDCHCETGVTRIGLFRYKAQRCGRCLKTPRAHFLIDIVEDVIRRIKDHGL